MANLLSEELKIDTAFIPDCRAQRPQHRSLTPMDSWRKALFVVEIGAMAAAATCALQAMQATDAAGGGPPR